MVINVRGDVILNITIKLLDQNNLVKYGVFSYDKIAKPYVAEGNDLAVLGIKNLIWRLGEKIQITIDHPKEYLWVQLDETLSPTLIYMKNKRWTYTIIPNKRLADTAFVSRHHCITVRKALKSEVECYRNLAFNPHDQINDSGVYPHVYSNVLAEDNPVFLAQNAIDGKLANISHGSYPFGSWGIHGKSDADLTIDFGRLVKIDMIKLLVRSDHLERPHDSFWKKITIEFSKDDRLVLNMTNSDDIQTFNFKPRVVNQIILKNLEKENDNLAFVALSQVEVYGTNSI